MNEFVDNFLKIKLCMPIVFLSFILKTSFLQKITKYAQLLCKVRKNSWHLEAFLENLVNAVAFAT